MTHRGLRPRMIVALAFLIAWRIVTGGASDVSARRTALQETLTPGLDHVPIAVADLDRAARQYRELGFALKPGMPHANGILPQASPSCSPT